MMYFMLLYIAFITGPHMFQMRIGCSHIHIWFFRILTVLFLFKLMTIHGKKKHQKSLWHTVFPWHGYYTIYSLVYGILQIIIIIIQCYSLRLFFFVDSPCWWNVWIVARLLAWCGVCAVLLECPKFVKIYFGLVLFRLNESQRDCSLACKLWCASAITNNIQKNNTNTKPQQNTKNG